MQDPLGYPEMEKGGHSNPHLGRNVRVRQAAFYQRWQSEGPRTGWVILVSEYWVWAFSSVLVFALLGVNDWRFCVYHWKRSNFCARCSV